MNNNIDCPVDFVTVDENRVRLVALLVGLLGILGLITGSSIIPAALSIDFALRAINAHGYSPLAILAGQVATLLKLKPKPVDRAPKRFAAFVGLGFVLFITLTLLTGLILAAQIATCILILFAALESLAGFCAGCYVYSILKRLGLIK